MNRFKIATLLSSLALVGALAGITVIPVSAAGMPAAPAGPVGYPTRYTESGVPQYGLVGQGIWQVAGIVNVGEPSIRIVYDQTVPGAHDRAMSYYYQLTGQLYQLSQPGVITGLREVGYSAHYDGVQFQLYGSNPYIDQQYSAIFAQYGMPLMPAGA